MDELLKQALIGATWEQDPKDENTLFGTQANGLPLVLEHRDEGIWLEITTYDDELEDGVEVLYKLEAMGKVGE